jgi:hypothetical protein
LVLLCYFFGVTDKLGNSQKDEPAYNVQDEDFDLQVDRQLRGTLLMSSAIGGRSTIAITNNSNSKAGS